MTRARNLAIRVGITVAVAVILAGVLWASGYQWDFTEVRRNWGNLLSALGLTLLATGVAYGLGILAGVFVALARISRPLAIRHVGDLYVAIVRGTPFLVQLMIAVFCVRPLIGNPSRFWTGTVALGLFAAAYIGEIFRGGIESIDRGQFEAARSLGLTRAQTMRHVILPQAFKRMIPPLTGELIALTKESSLLYAIGVWELVFVAEQVGLRSAGGFEAYLVAAAIYLAINIPLSLLARRLERRLGRSARSGIHL